jgi:hypothetical protein
MGFKKDEPVNEYHELELHTQYRFAEIEMSFAIRSLATLFRNRGSARHHATSTIYEAIAPNYSRASEFQDRFIETTLLQTFVRPHKKEIIHYLIMRNHSYGVIRQLTSASPNTISHMKIGLPEYYPLFDRWTPEMLDSWNTIKNTINAFNQPLYYS